VNAPAHASRRGERGSALIEVLVSLLLFSVGIVGLVRLLGTAVKDTGEIEYRAQAAALADEQIGLMWADNGPDSALHPTLDDYEIADDPVPELPGGTRTVDVQGNVVTVTIAWQPPGAPARNHVVVATVSGN
jgi:type IV pilus assembly protein PilV